MSATILDGKVVAATIRDAAVAEAKTLQAEHRITPTLAMLRVGQDDAQMSHARSVRRSFEKAGFGFQEHELPEDTSQAVVSEALANLNADPGVHGILIQVPLPPGFDKGALIDLLNPLKDVDGVTALNAGYLSKGRGRYHGATTPVACIALLEHYKIPIEGQRAVVVGASDIVGKPLAMLLLQRQATITQAHSRTRDLGAVCREADLLCVAVGKAGLITSEMVRPGVVVVDIGINFVGDTLVGDVEYDAVAAVASAITPVPGGVGPVTGAVLLRNTLQAARWLLEDSATYQEAFMPTLPPH